MTAIRTKGPQVKRAGTAIGEDTPSGEVFTASCAVSVNYKDTAYVIGDVPAGVMLETLANAASRPAGHSGTELGFLSAAVTLDDCPVSETWLKTLPWRVFSRWLQIAQEVNGLDAGATEREKKT